MANNMAMTPEDKAELARLDAEQVEDDAEVIQIAVERAQHAQQGVGWQERNVQWLESASNRIEELKRRRTARNAARERVLMRVSDGAVVLNDGSSGKPSQTDHCMHFFCRSESTIHLALSCTHSHTAHMAEHGKPITDARQYIFTEEVSRRHFSTTQATPTARQR